MRTTAFAVMTAVCLVLWATPTVLADGPEVPPEWVEDQLGHSCTDTGQNSYDCVKWKDGCLTYWTDDDGDDDHTDDGAHVEHRTCT